MTKYCSNTRDGKATLIFQRMRHKDTFHYDSQIDLNVSLLWSPFGQNVSHNIKNKIIPQLRKFQHKYTRKLKHILIIGFGLWYIRLKKLGRSGNLSIEKMWLSEYATSLPGIVEVLSIQHIILTLFYSFNIKSEGLTGGSGQH